MQQEYSALLLSRIDLLTRRSFDSQRVRLAAVGGLGAQNSITVLAVMVRFNDDRTCGVL
jgi:hypothetical protein